VVDFERDAACMPIGEESPHRFMWICSDACDCSHYSIVLSQETKEPKENCGELIFRSWVHPDLRRRFCTQGGVSCASEGIEGYKSSGEPPRRGSRKRVFGQPTCRSFTNLLPLVEGEPVCFLTAPSIQETCRAVTQMTETATIVRCCPNYIIDRKASSHAFAISMSTHVNWVSGPGVERHSPSSTFPIKGPVLQGIPLPATDSQTKEGPFNVWPASMARSTVRPSTNCRSDEPVVVRADRHRTDLNGHENGVEAPERSARIVAGLSPVALTTRRVAEWILLCWSARIHCPPPK
jgi:hypothetical protein